MKAFGDWAGPRGVCMVMAAVAFATAGACQGPEEYHRGAQASGGGGGTVPIGGRAGAGSAGTAGAGAGGGGRSGTAGALGTAGANGGAGATGAAGTLGSTGFAGATGGAGMAGATGAGGATSAGGGGAGGAPVPCSGCKVGVLYTCLSDASDQASFVLDVSNKGAAAFLLSDLTLRYWYTAEVGKDQELNCDNAKLGCTHLLTSSSAPPARFQAVTPPRTNANEYVEIAFTAGAIDVSGSTGMIQLRMHNKDFTPMNQSDDYSVDCATKGTAKDSSRITAYLKGTLVGGTEPP
jgi:hypothetical protein